MGTQSLEPGPTSGFGEEKAGLLPQRGGAEPPGGGSDTHSGLGPLRLLQLQGILPLHPTLPRMVPESLSLDTVRTPFPLAAGQPLVIPKSGRRKNYPSHRCQQWDKASQVAGGTAGPEGSTRNLPRSQGFYSAGVRGPTVVVTIGIIFSCPLVILFSLGFGLGN